MKKAISFISVLVLITGAFVSCGDKESGSSSKEKDKKSKNGIVGTWVPSEDTLKEMNKGIFGGMTIEKAELAITEKDITMNASVNASEVLCVTDDDFTLYGQSFDKEYDGEVITVIADGIKVAEFNRVDDPDKDNVYGKYTNEEISATVSGGEIVFDFIESGVSYMVMSDKQTYTYDEKSGKFTTTNADGEEDESTAKVDGDTLTVTDSDGNVETYSRAD